VEHAASSRPVVTGRVFRLLGEGPVAEALRAEIQRRGGLLEGDPDVVIDTGAPLLEAFAEARRLDANPPRVWLSVLVETTDTRAARDGGARSGLTKSLGREWERCFGRVLLLDGLESDGAARAVLEETAVGDGASEVRRTAAERFVQQLRTVPFPPRAPHPGKAPVVLLTGGTRGITARVARAWAERGPVSLILVGRTGPGPSALNEAGAREAVKARLAARHDRVTPRMVEDEMRPLRVAEEVRQTVEELRALGASVDVRVCDLADPEAVSALVAELTREYPQIDVCVHGAGVEESRKLADKDEAAFRRVYDGKAQGGLALLEALPWWTFFVSMGSVAGRFGNPGQVDYAAANDGLAHACRTRRYALHLDWTAWADTGMAVRGGMEKLLTDRGVELLPAGPGAELVVDLVGAGVTGELVVAGRLGDFVEPALHPLLDSVQFEGDVVVARRLLSVGGDP